MKMRAGATTRADMDFVKIANRLLGCSPGEMTNSPEHTLLKVVWIGIVTENCPYMTCPDLAKHAKYRSHSNIVSLRQQWFEMKWKDRHGWLLMAEMMKSPQNQTGGAMNAQILKNAINKLHRFFVVSPNPATVGKDGFLP